MIIPLTFINNEEVLVNSSKIIYMEQFSDYTRIYLDSDNYLNVKDEAQEVAKLINSFLKRGCK